MKEATIEALVNAAMSVLHHDACEATDVDEKSGVEIIPWEKQRLREKFELILKERP